MEKLHIQLNKDQNIFFTSDMHFGHSNVIRFCNRPFVNTKEMDRKLIENWNKVVKENDIVFSLGDLEWFPSKSTYMKRFKRLNGFIYFICGNHDDYTVVNEAIKKYNLEDKVHLCQDIVCLYLEAEHLHLPRKINEIIMCHYPLWTWSHSDSQTIHLYGHVHSENWRECQEFNIPIAHRKNCLDVGSDAHNYTPIDINRVFFEIRENGLNLSDKSWGLQGYDNIVKR